MLYARIELPDAARHVSAEPPYIYTTTVSKSFHVYCDVWRNPYFNQDDVENVLEIDGTEPPLVLKPFFGDGMARNSITHLTVPIPLVKSHEHDGMSLASISESPVKQKLLLITDRSATLAVLPHPTTTSHQTGVQPLLQTTLPQCITRLAHAPVRPPWLSSIKSSGVLASNIIGTTVDGTVYSLTILDQPSRVLLKFLENLVLWHREGILVRTGRSEGKGASIIDPEMETWKARVTSSRAVFAFGGGTAMPHDPGFGRSSTGHGSPGSAGDYCINADRLQQFVLPGGTELLLQWLLQSDWEHETLIRVGNDVETRCKRFIELCDDVIPSDHGESESSGRERLERAVGRCILWLRNVAGDFL